MIKYVTLIYVRNKQQPQYKIAINGFVDTEEFESTEKSFFNILINVYSTKCGKNLLQTISLNDIEGHYTYKNKDQQYNLNKYFLQVRGLDGSMIHIKDSEIRPSQLKTENRTYRKKYEKRIQEEYDKRLNNKIQQAICENK